MESNHFHNGMNISLIGHLHEIALLDEQDVPNCQNPIPKDNIMVENGENYPSY